MRTTRETNRGIGMRDSHGFTDQYRHGYHNQDNDTYYNRGYKEEDDDRFEDDGRGNYRADYDDGYYDERDEDGYVHDDYTRDYDQHHGYGSNQGNFERHYSQQYGGSSQRRNSDDGSNNNQRNAYYSTRRNNHYQDSDRDPARREDSYPSYRNNDNDYTNRSRNSGYSSYSSRGNNETRESRDGRYGSSNNNGSRRSDDYSSRNTSNGRNERSGRYGSTHGNSGRGYSNYSSERYSGDDRNPLRNGDYGNSYDRERTGRQDNRETLYSFGGYDSETSSRRGENRMPLNSRSYYYDDGRHDNSYRQERDGSYSRNERRSQSGRQGFARMDKDRLQKVAAKGGRNSYKNDYSHYSPYHY